MAVHTIPRANTASTDPWADAAKMFLQSPAVANDYMNQAQQAMAVAESPRPQYRPGSGDPYSMSDRDLLAGVLTAEGGGFEDMRYIANVIQNRAASGQYPGTYRDVILQPGQFSAFNGVTGYAGGQGANDLWLRPTGEAYEVADHLLNMGLLDATGGALNYYNPDLASPAWGGSHFRRLPGSAHVFGTS